ncbi:MAG: TonB-dependent receptor plug domain-containing protein [Ginsengibacter sp.]|jgi:iron complex outermembrane receptor protein
MKKIVIAIVGICLFFGVNAQDTIPRSVTDTLMLENIEITSTRAADKAPFAKTNLNKEQISKVNLGQDLPFVLNNTPSVVVNSDAGNGVGYTGIRIRGSDAARINVTLNGIPYNDAESQGTFFVDMPDISSSLNSIQIQRGVGTSSNGAGAFGATINLSTNEINKEKYLELNNSFGSFNTWKNTLKAGSGLLGNHFLIDGRFSRITSNGYMDRATSDLLSYFVSAAYINAKSSLRFNIISGKEKTYQAWGGVPESFLESNRTYNPAGTEKPGEPYDNETDNFIQTHYQLFYNKKINSLFQFNTAIYLTRGKGYYEEYRAGQKFSSYGLPDLVYGNETIKKTDLVRQKWLDNYLYGTIFSLQYHHAKTHLTFGGGWSQYDGKHNGIVKWADKGGFPLNYEYYNNPAQKNDFNLYGKVMQSLGSGFTAFVDVQGRFLNYAIHGFKDNPSIDLEKRYSFFNPKAGVSFNKNNYQIYLSLAMAYHEPNRDDFEAGIQQIPTPEKLLDWEFGIEKKEKDFQWGMTFYFMDYDNQLISTGKINDVGAYTRVNTPKSYRSGIELQGSTVLTSCLNIGGNISFSKNKIKSFTEFVDNWDDATAPQKQNNFSNTDISFSPNTVGAAMVNLIPIKNAELSFQSKYVSQQFLDNTSNKNRIIPAYFIQNIRMSYSLESKTFKGLDFIFQLNNVFNKIYVANGYTYNYISGGSMQVENYYFPMAGTNFMIAINMKL